MPNKRYSFGKNLLLFLLHFIIITMVFFIQTSIMPLLPNLNAIPNLLLILTFSMSLYFGSLTGILYGILSGIYLDLLYTGQFGFFTLILSTIGYFNGYLSIYFNNENIVLPIWLSIINDFIFNFYIYFFRFFSRNRYDFIYYLNKIIIPEIVITLLFTILTYKFIILIYSKKGMN